MSTMLRSALEPTASQRCEWLTATASMLLVLRWQLASSRPSPYRQMPANESRKTNWLPTSTMRVISPSLKRSSCSSRTALARPLSCSPAPVHSASAMSSLGRLMGRLMSKSSARRAVLTSMRDLSAEGRLKSMKRMGLSTSSFSFCLKYLELISQSSMMWARSEMRSMPSAMNFSLGPSARWLMHRTCLKFSSTYTRGRSSPAATRKKRRHSRKAMMTSSYLLLQTMLTAGLSKWCALASSPFPSSHTRSSPDSLSSTSCASSLLKNIAWMRSSSSKRHSGTSLDSDFPSFRGAGSKRYSYMSPLVTPMSSFECRLLLLILRLCTSTSLALRGEASRAEATGEGRDSRLMLTRSRRESSPFWKDQRRTCAGSSQEAMLPVAMSDCETARQVMVFWCSSRFTTSPDSRQSTSSPLSLASSRFSPRKSMQVLVTGSSLPKLATFTSCPLSSCHSLTLSLPQVRKRSWLPGRKQSAFTCQGRLCVQVTTASVSSFSTSIISSCPTASSVSPQSTTRALSSEAATQSTCTSSRRQKRRSMTLRLSSQITRPQGAPEWQASSSSPSPEIARVLTSCRQKVGSSFRKMNYLRAVSGSVTSTAWPLLQTMRSYLSQWRLFLVRSALRPKMLRTRNHSTKSQFLRTARSTSAFLRCRSTRSRSSSPSGTSPNRSLSSSRSSPSAGPSKRSTVHLMTHSSLSPDVQTTVLLGELQTSI